MTHPFPGLFFSLRMLHEKKNDCTGHLTWIYSTAFGWKKWFYIVVIISINIVWVLFLIVILWLHWHYALARKKRQFFSDFLLFYPANIISGMFSCQADITLCSCNHKWSYITVFRHSPWEDRKEGQCIAFHSEL